MPPPDELNRQSTVRDPYGDRDVACVVPGRDCAWCIEPCLQALAAIRDAPGSRLREIIFVDDRSTDDSASIAERFGARVLQGPGRGAAGARNVGFREAQTPLVWFVDADCVAEPDALVHLMPHIAIGGVAGVSGSYGIQNSESRLARLIHEEILVRHDAMCHDVNFAATFNVLYRREMLERLDGFDERYRFGQDAELAFRMIEVGHRIRFDPRSRVRHHHPAKLLPYLRKQRGQGYWRVPLHLEHRGHAGGDSYSSLLDHASPPIALLALVSLGLLFPAVWLPWLALPPLMLIALLFIMQVPMALRMLRRSGRLEMLLFIPMSMLRALWRGFGLAAATIDLLLRRLPGRHAPPDAGASPAASAADLREPRP
jgi:glycosyltransferase involved in cell wall biosynthesis